MREQSQIIIDELVILRDKLASDDAAPTGELMDKAIQDLDRIIEMVELLQLASTPQVCPGEDQRDC